jgi:hypothetical protein
LEILELIRKSVYAQINRKIVLLDKTLKKLTLCVFSSNFYGKPSLFPISNILNLAQKIENIGRMIGG